MNKISCALCRDLIPLVQDGVASPDSVQAVTDHIAGCPQCQNLFSGELPPPADGQKSLQKLHAYLRMSTAMVLMFGIFFGLSLTAMEDMFYNVLIMPVIGGLGYYLFRKKALFAVPLLLFATHLAIYLLNLARHGAEIDFLSTLTWSFLYSLFALLGTIVTWLLHFAFRKER